MSYFHSPQCEYKAKRITQLLAPEPLVAAQRDGRVICNIRGHAHLFDLNELGQLFRVAHGDIVPHPTEEKPTVSIL